MLYYMSYLTENSLLVLNYFLGLSAYLGGSDLLSPTEGISSEIVRLTVVTVTPYIHAGLWRQIPK